MKRGRCRAKVLVGASNIVDELEQNMKRVRLNDENQENIPPEGEKPTKIRRIVKFADQVEAHAFDKEDPPAINILDDDRAYSRALEERDKEGTVENPLRISKEQNVKQAFSLDYLDFQTRREFDTETMTTAELREALALKQLSTKGTKHQLQERLEKALLEDQGVDTKKIVKGNCSSVEVPQWLQW